MFRFSFQSRRMSHRKPMHEFRLTQSMFTSTGSAQAPVGACVKHWMALQVMREAFKREDAAQAAGLLPSFLLFAAASASESAAGRCSSALEGKIPASAPASASTVNNGTRAVATLFL